MELKRILYVHSRDSTFGVHHTNMVAMRRPYSGYFYNGWLKAEFPQHVKQQVRPGIGVEEIFDILRKYGDRLDLIVVDGLANNHLILPYRLREEEKLTKAKILASPIHITREGESREDSLEQSVKDSMADFGLQIPAKTETVVTAFDNIFAGRTGGYIFNPDLYEDRNGVLVAKE